jgi:hypothetical protein
VQEEEEEVDKDTGGGEGGVHEEEEHAGARGGEATDFEGQQHFGVIGERVNGLQRLASEWDEGAGKWVRGLRVGDKLEVYSYKSRPSTEYFCSTKVQILTSFTRTTFFFNFCKKILTRRRA